jgi:hypothetical protein
MCVRSTDEQRAFQVGGVLKGLPPNEPGLRVTKCRECFVTLLFARLQANHLRRKAPAQFVLRRSVKVNLVAFVSQAM